MGGIAVLAEWTLLVLWLIGPAASEWHHRLQPLAWVPDWVWFAAILPLALAGLLLWRGASRSWSGRGFRLILASSPVFAVSFGVLERDWRPLGSPGRGGPRLVFLNANDPPKDRAGEVVESILALEPEVVVVTNPGWMASAWRGLSALETPRGDWSIRWVHPVMVATRSGGASLRTLVRANDVAVVRARFDPPTAGTLGIDELLVVDLPSDQMVDRGELIDGLAETIERDARDRDRRPRIVLGDLNLTPRTPGLDRLVPGLSDLFVHCGRGWGATWPREFPLVRIDFALVADDVAIDHVRTFDPGVGNHLGLLIELQTRETAIQDGGPTPD